MTEDESAPTARVVTLAEHAPTPDAPARRIPGGQADLIHAGAGARLDAGADAWLVLAGRVGDLARLDAAAPVPAGAVVPEGARVLAFASHADAPAPAAAQKVRVDPGRVSANAFLPLLEDSRVALALLSLAPARRMDAGPESDRAFLVLAGGGLVFLPNDVTLPFEEGDLILVPAGEPARVWARGPEETKLVAFQPQGHAPVEQRSLLGEIRKRRDEG